MKEPGQAKQFGRYEIRKELGRGMMGVVYEAHDTVLGRMIALKTIQVALAASDRDRGDFERRFLAEAAIAARLSHSGIVIVHDVGRDAEHGILYIALEYLHGRTLAEVADEGPLDWRETLRIVGRVAEALRHAHGQGVVHRDIKPSNIMLVAGNPKIMDFGIAKLEAGQLTQTGQLFGTPLYMSPEQALGQAVDARTDLFSLGSVAYRLLSGRSPFEAPNVPGILARVAYQQPKPLRELVPGVPPEVEYLVTRAMTKEPAHRYPDARMLSEDIDDILAGRPPRHRAGWAPPPTGAETLASRREGALPELPLDIADVRRASRRRRRPALSLVFLLAGAAAVYFYLHPSDREFWRSAAVEARRAPIVEELREWWPLLVGDQPTPAPPRPAVQVSEPTAAFAAPSLLATSPLGEPAPTQNTSPPATEGPAAPDPDAAEADARPGRAPEEPLPAATVAPTTSDVPAPSHAADPEAPGELSIEFEHHLRRGNLQVWVDDALLVDEDFDSRVTHKVLAFEIRKGSVHELLPLSPGRHHVRVQVRWDGNVKSARTSGTFPPGATRRVKVQVGRLRGNVSLAWK